MPDESPERQPSIKPVSSVQGEDHHDSGDDSERSIIRWLKMTTRVEQFYERDTELVKTLLVYKWPYSDDNFSFDFGGKFRGGEIDKQVFLAESKGHNSSKNLPAEYRKFLASVYSVCAYHPNPPSHFLWIAFSPHGTDKWGKLSSAAEIKAALLHKDNLMRVFGTDDPAHASGAIDPEALVSASAAIWILIYSDHLQTISLEKEHYQLIQAHIEGEAIAL